MKILVTGSAGFIGFHLCKSLLKDGHQIMGIDSLEAAESNKISFSRLELLKPYENFFFEKINICNEKMLSVVFKKFKPEFVVNLAAKCGVRESYNNPSAYIESNLVGFSNLIHLSSSHSVEGFIYASSSSVYGSNTNVKQSINDKVDSPLSLYASTKSANELIAYSYSKMVDLHTTGLRYFTVYGPWCRPDMAMFTFTKNIYEGRPISVFNNGKMKRDFTYIDDIIEGTKLTIVKNYKNEIFNLGNSKSVKLMDMISVIETNLEKKAIINYEPIQPGDMLNTCADIEHSSISLGFRPKTSIKTGIPKLIKWYKEYYV